jgi:HEAT repeat protein
MPWALSDASASVRANAAEALGEMGGATAAAIPALKVATSDPDINVQDQATNSLGLVQP